MRLEVRLVLVFVGTAAGIILLLALIGGIEGYDLYLTGGAALMTTLVYLEKHVDDRGRPRD